MFDEERHIGLAIKVAANLLERRMHMDGVPSLGPQATPMQGRIIKYLYKNAGRGDLFQRDLEQYFSIRRSTATGILNLMERDGLLRRESVGYDARLKKLVLTETAKECHRRVDGRITETERLIGRGLTEEELESFFTIMEKIRKNLE